jgi:hypothetical protein
MDDEQEIVFEVARSLIELLRGDLREGKGKTLLLDDERICYVLNIVPTPKDDPWAPQNWAPMMSAKPKGKTCPTCKGKGTI